MNNIFNFIIITNSYYNFNISSRGGALTGALVNIVPTNVCEPQDG